MRSKNKAKNRTVRGAGFYTKRKKLKPILVYVDPGTHAALKKLADEDDRSLQKSIKRILTEYAKVRRKGR